MTKFLTAIAAATMSVIASSQGMADVEFWYQNRGSVGAQGILYGKSSGSLQRIYLGAPQGEKISPGKKWLTAKCVFNCERLDRRYVVKLTNLANTNDVYCEAEFYYEPDGLGTIAITFQVTHTSPGKTCTANGMTSIQVDTFIISDPTAWVELKLTD